MYVCGVSPGLFLENRGERFVNNFSGGISEESFRELRRLTLELSTINPLRWQLGSRTITSDRTVYDNSSHSFRTRPYDITG